MITGMEIKRLRRRQVMEKMGWSSSTLNERLQAGQFIKPKYEVKTPYLLNLDVDAYIEKFFAGEDRQPIGAALND